jgi:poly(3-hydroxybutyrate) depolymerase
MAQYSKLASLICALSACASVAFGCSSSDATSSGGVAGASSSAAGQSSAASGASSVAGAGAGATPAAGTSSGGQASGAQAGSSAGGASAGGMNSGGASGSAATAGAAGMSTAGAGGMSTGTVAKPSTGCNMPAGQALKSWVAQPNMMVAGASRQWWVWLPNNYDPSKAYPTIFLFHGCGDVTNVVPMQNATNDQAILVRGAGTQANTCWDQSPDGVDVTFFDQMLTAVSAQRCVDTARVFAVGYSSGSWLVNSLDCRRADKLRGAATVSGGYESSKCSGEIARIFIHDTDDMDNVIAGSITERTRLITANHCSMTTLPDDPSPCVRYQGCDAAYPIDWCQTSGKMHDRQDSLAPTAFWKFFTSLN